MRYYKDSENKIYALEDNIDANDWLDFKFTEITESEADKILNPPPTQEQYIEIAEREKQVLIAEASEKTELWRTQLVLGIITDEDKASLKEWMLYVQKVQAIDVSTAPDIFWPVKP